MRELEPNIDLVRDHFIDPFSSVLVRPISSKTAIEIIKEASKFPQTELEMELAIREKERDLR